MQQHNTIILNKQICNYVVDLSSSIMKTAIRCRNSSGCNIRPSNWNELHPYYGCAVTIIDKWPSSVIKLPFHFHFFPSVWSCGLRSHIYRFCDKWRLFSRLTKFEQLQNLMISVYKIVKWKMTLSFGLGHDAVKWFIAQNG